jgi:DNA-binding SARP family transcriptional activator
LETVKPEIMTNLGHAQASTAHANRPRVPQVSLLGGFAVAVGDVEILLPSYAQRVLARLCVAGRPYLPQPRTMLAGWVWPESSTERAQANLRTALWRIRQADARLVTTVQEYVRLGSEVRVDVHDSLAQAGRLLSDEPLRVDDTRLEPLSLDLLPCWDSDWLLVERERVHQIRLHALEALSSRLLADGRIAQAVQAALAAIATEPLRESAHSALIAAYLGEGNSAEAYQHFQQYSRLLWSELRLSPSVTFEQLLARYSGRAAVERA